MNGEPQEIRLELDESTARLVQEALEDPKILDSFQRKALTEDFKEKYHVDKTTPFRCPACRDTYSGALWIDYSDQYRFVCRKCFTEFKLECKTVSNDELMIALRLANKEGLNVREAIDRCRTRED